MDIDLLKTFLEVHRTRHFGRAAENLFLTQSAVSARVHQLEELLGAPLFTRTRNDIRLTPAGTRFLGHAETILNAWNRARQDSAPAGRGAVALSIGGVFGLWDVLPAERLHALYRELPDVALAVEAHGQEALVRKLRDGALDIVFLYEPPPLAGLAAAEVARLRLVMVAARAGLGAREAVRKDYLLTEWGASFALEHARHFPDMPPPQARLAPARLALAFLLADGGAAYLAEPMVSEHLKAGRLHPVKDAPAIERPVYAVHARAATAERRALIEEALSCLTTARRGKARARA